MRVEVFKYFKLQSDPITMLLCFLIGNRHKCAPLVFFEYYKIPEDYCQRPGEYLSGVLMFYEGICGDLITRGCLTFVRVCDSLLAKITTLRDIKRHISYKVSEDLKGLNHKT
jgi:hypothetical protein